MSGDEKRCLFLIGAPKCGTSSLFDQLNLHPDIFGSVPKETFALLSQKNPLSESRHFHSLEDLRNSCFSKSCNQRNGVLLEGTTHHLFSTTAAQAVAEAGDAAKVIVMLRHPAMRVLSSFRYTQQNLARIPKSLTFQKYVDLLLDDRQESIRKMIAHPVSGHVLAKDLDYSNYEHYLSRWYQIVGRDRIRVLIAEEYFNNPLEVVNNLFSWLSLTPLKDQDIRQLERQNQTRRIGSVAVHRIAQRLNRVFPAGRFFRPIKTAYFQIQQAFSSREQEDFGPSLKKLKTHFAPQIRKLSALLGRDLRVWETDIR